MALNIDEFSETRADKETLIETKYTGDNPTLRKSSGVAYLNLQDNQWFYRPTWADEDEFFRVDGDNLSCNDDKGWIRCDYLGLNPKPARTGRAYFNEGEGVWMYRPKGEKEEYRIKNDSSLLFIRDSDYGVE